MNPTLQKKIQKFKALQDMKAQFDEMNDDGDNLGSDFQGPSSLAFLRAIPDCVTDEAEATSIIAMMFGGRAGHAAPSIGVEESPSADQIEKPRAAPVAKPAPKVITDTTPIAFGYVQSDDRSMLPEPAPSIVIVEPEPVTIVAPAMVVQAAAPEPREVQAAGEPAWAIWTDPKSDGFGPEGIDVDDAIAYRMKDGSVLFTDYPHDLNWIHESEPGDIVEYRLLTAQEVADMLPWTAWTGGECPVDPTTMVQIRLFNWGYNNATNAGLQNWQHHAKGHHNYDCNIVAYRAVTA